MRKPQDPPMLGSRLCLALGLHVAYLGLDISHSTLHLHFLVLEFYF